MPDTNDIIQDIDARLRSVEQEVSVISTRIGFFATGFKVIIGLVGASLGVDLLPMINGGF